MSAIQMTSALRVDRRCPRCRFHGYHYLASDGAKCQGGRAVRILCTNCSHVWTGRIKSSELSSSECHLLSRYRLDGVES